MSIIQYSNDRTFNIPSSVKNGWGIDYHKEKDLLNLTLRDRKNKKHKETIKSVDWFMGIMRVFFMRGGWQCLDNCIEQFELDKK